MYVVTEKYRRPNDQGHYYRVFDEDRVSAFRHVTFYRTSNGREMASDHDGDAIVNEGAIFSLVKRAVDDFDRAHNEQQEDG